MEHPERTATHKAAICAHGRASWLEIEVVGYAERQGCDMPAIRIAVTTHRAEVKRGPECGSTTTGAFPPCVTQAVQDGPAVQSWAASLTHHQHIPVERTTQICAALVHQPLGAATVLKASEDFSACIEPAREAVQELWRDRAGWHGDESGLRVQGNLPWLHVASTDRLTQDAVRFRYRSGKAHAVIVHHEGEPLWQHRERDGDMLRLPVLYRIVDGFLHHAIQVRKLLVHYDSLTLDDISEGLSIAFNLVAGIPGLDISGLKAVTDDLVTKMKADPSLTSFFETAFAEIRDVRAMSR